MHRTNEPVSHYRVEHWIERKQRGWIFWKLTLRCGTGSLLAWVVFLIFNFELGTGIEKAFCKNNPHGTETHRSHSLCIRAKKCLSRNPEIGWLPWGKLILLGNTAASQNTCTRSLSLSLPADAMIHHINSRKSKNICQQHLWMQRCFKAWPCGWRSLRHGSYPHDKNAPFCTGMIAGSFRSRKPALTPTLWSELIDYMHII